MRWIYLAIIVAFAARDGDFRAAEFRDRHDVFPRLPGPPAARARRSPWSTSSGPQTAAVCLLWLRRSYKGSWRSTPSSY